MVPVVTDDQLLKFRELGGAGHRSRAIQQADNLIDGGGNADGRADAVPEP